MLVRDIMRSPALAISAETTLEDAYQTMQEKAIRHLLVLEGEKLVGVVTDRDLRLATSALAPRPFFPGSQVADVMHPDPITADPSDPVEDAARIMRGRKIGCLPVLDDGRLVGIVTGLDLLDALIRMTGVDKPSSRLELRLPDRPGELARLTALLGEKELNIHSILSYPESPDAVRTVLRIGSIEIRMLAQELRRAGFVVLWPPEKPWPR
jgi:acetoin utilization protein AcuB